MATKKSEKSELSDILFYCELCDYKCFRKYDFNKHIMTAKHKKQQQSTEKSEKSEKSENKFACVNCKKEFKDRTGHWRHKKKCVIQKYENTEVENVYELLNNITPGIILNVIQQNQEFKNILIEQNKQNFELQKQNNELQKQIFEVIKNGTHNNNNNNTNSHNKTFNLQFFLNETCKDAMNIMDFVDSIKIQLSDLENVGKIGYVEGISSIIVKNLNSLDETKRPVHCTDSKREVMYVKDEDKWEKENEEKLKLRKAIKHVAYKNTKMLGEFRTKNPDCLKSTSKMSDKYNKLVMEAMGGKGDNDLEKEDKIIRNIAKEVTIDSKA